jgi:hypothetical protein
MPHIRWTGEDLQCLPRGLHRPAEPRVIGMASHQLFQDLKMMLQPGSDMLRHLNVLHRLRIGEPPRQIVPQFLRDRFPLVE